ncbi:hypothetical protein A2U01_0037862, partial [Trifolium medium]|nr:hypothetical protein [Trifolium medium]
MNISCSSNPDLTTSSPNPKTPPPSPQPLTFSTIAADSGTWIVPK